MDLKTRIEVVELYFLNGGSSTAALRAYKTKHNLRRDPFTTSTITRLISRFRETGSVADKPRSGRPSQEDERTPVVMIELERLQQSHDFAVASSYSVSHATGIPQSSVHRILRRGLCLYPYRLQANQALSESDKKKRVDFAQLMLSDEIDLESVLWTDESYFSLSGTVTRHNAIIWGSQRPTQSVRTTLHDPKVCVWFGYSARYRLTPYFFSWDSDWRQLHRNAALSCHSTDSEEERIGINHFPTGWSPASFFEDCQKFSVFDFSGREDNRTRILPELAGLLTWPFTSGLLLLGNCEK